jgi:hypothetical protein
VGLDGAQPTQLARLSSAICANGDRIDLLVVPLDTGAATVQAAMAPRRLPTPSTPGHLTAVTDRRATEAETSPETAWESEGAATFKTAHLDPAVSPSPHLDEGRAHPTVGSSRSPSRTRIRDERALMATGAGVYPALR